MLPILLYHRIDVLKPSLPAITRRLTVAPSDFAAQLEWLTRHGYHALTQRQMFDALEHGTRLPAKPILITFDDGYRDVLGKASPLLERLQMPATAYVITGRISGPHPSFLTWSNLRALALDASVSAPPRSDDESARPEHERVVRLYNELGPWGV